MKIKGITLTKKRIVGFTAMMLVFSLVLAGAVSALTTGAWFFDVETSNDNIFTAGTLDLTIDDQNGPNVVKFTVGDMAPGDPAIVETWTLKNIGSITGYLSLSRIDVTGQENGVSEPEAAAGDTTPNVGELHPLVDVTLFVDTNENGTYEAGTDVLIAQRRANELNGKKYLLKIPMGPEEKVSIGAMFEWPALGYYLASDNQAMGDSFEMDVQFLLSQTTGIPN